MMRKRNRGLAHLSCYLGSDMCRIESALYSVGSIRPSLDPCAIAPLRPFAAILSVAEPDL